MKKKPQKTKVKSSIVKGLIGQRVTLICWSNEYIDVPVWVGDEEVLLENARVSPRDTFSSGTSVYVRLAAIEAFEVVG